MRFGSRDAAVVGGSREIGRACSLRLASEGANVVVIDHDAEEVERTRIEIQELGVAALGITSDLSNPAGAQIAADQCAELGWCVDVLVNVHMETDWMPIESGDLEQWEKTFRVNATGPYAWTRAFLPQLKQSGRGSIVHLGSVDGLFGNPRVPAYSASKAALIPMTHIMAHEFGKYPVRVNTVGRVATSLRKQLPSDPPGYVERLVSSSALGRLGKPEETAAAVAFLASDEASYITGTMLVVDGGRSALTGGTY
jgi:NAD(P)-dependent dehydrogenase (short-subunit alcohol dehydrogenase family)